MLFNCGCRGNFKSMPWTTKKNEKDVRVSIRNFFQESKQPSRCTSNMKSLEWRRIEVYLQQRISNDEKRVKCTKASTRRRISLYSLLKYDGLWSCMNESRWRIENIHSGKLLHTLDVPNGAVLVLDILRDSEYSSIAFHSSALRVICIVQSYTYSRTVRKWSHHPWERDQSFSWIRVLPVL